MPINPYAGGVVFLVAVGLFLVTLSAQGAPTTPTVTSPTILNPSVGQTVTFTITTHFYSLQTPNTVDQPGTRAVYSVWAGTVNLVSNATAPLLPGPSGSNLLFATVTVNVPQLCGSTCATYVESLVFTAQIHIVTYMGNWNSPTATYVFSGGAPPPTPAANQPIPWVAFAYELFVPILGIILAVAILIAVFLARIPGAVLAVASGLGIAALALTVLGLGVH